MLQDALTSGKSAPRLERAIGLTGATCLVVGSTIGSAIFLTSGIMVQRMPSASLLLLAWLAGGVLALAGGVTFAEVRALCPQSGGWSVVFDEAYWAVLRVLF